MYESSQQGTKAATSGLWTDQLQPKKRHLDISNTKNEPGYSDNVHHVIEKVCIVKYTSLMPSSERGTEDQSFVLSLIENIYDGCYQRKIHPYVTICNTNDYTDILENIINDREDAIIVICYDMELSVFKAITEMDFKNIPVVFVGGDTTCERYNTVSVAEMEESYAAVKHLFDCGYREIGYIHSNLEQGNFIKRGIGFDNAIRDLGMRCAVRLSILPHVREAQKYVSNWLREKPPIPCAFFVDNDNSAFGAMNAFKEIGLRIPEDISIIGMDDLVFSSLSSPPLTTIHISRQQMAQSILDLLHWGTMQTAVHIACRGRLIIRESTRSFDWTSESGLITKY